jgi:hypothetical protein
MNPNEKERRRRDHMAPKLKLSVVKLKVSYEKPKITTFGSVAKLTMSGGATSPDGHHTHRARHHA